MTFASPLQGASVSLFSQDAGSTELSLIGSTSTDESGRYSFTFPRDQVQSYEIHVEENNYFPIIETIAFSDVSIESDNIFHFATAAKSWVNLHFVNTAPSAPTDVLRFIKQDGKSNCQGCAPEGDQFINGIVDTVITYMNDGNTAFSYLYEVIGTSDFGVMSANTTAFDTTEILLNY